MTERSSGWYADPTGRHEYRYWDSTWTDYVADGGVTTVEPVGAVDTTTGAVPGLPGTKSGQAHLAHVPSHADASGGAASAHPTSRRSQDPEIERARQLMEQFAASMGSNDRLWECLEAVGRAGGYVGAEKWFSQPETSEGRDVRPLMDKPWQWLLRVSSRAHEQRVGDELLPAQVFLFAWMFTEQWAPNMRAVDFFEIGLTAPLPATYKGLATGARRSVAGIPDEVPVMQTPTEVVDAGMTRQFCDHVLRAAT